MGFEKFECGADCIEAIKKIAETLPKRESAPYIIISGTPMESLWPAKDVTLGVDGTTGIKGHTDQYDTVAYGKDRQTPWGPLPACIIAVRHDIANVINGKVDVKKAVQVMHEATVQAWKKEEKRKKPLMGPDWKPAPGFERI